MSKYKDIPGYNKIYGISEYGEVIKYEAARPYKIKGYTALYKQKTMAQSVCKKGYHRVSLFVNEGIRRQKAEAIHRLVYKTYKGEIGKGLQINHIDGNKSNNHISNLELCTGIENIQHAWKNGLIKPRYGANNPAAKLTEKDVVKIRQIYDGKEFSQRKLAKMFNVDRVTIAAILKKRIWKEIIS